MGDYMLQGTIGNGSARIYILESTNIVSEAEKRHDTSVSVSAALGRVLTATSLLGAMQKDDNQSVTFSIKSDGPVKGLIATSDKTGNVKGYPLVLNVDVPLKPNGKIDVSGLVGKGILTIIKDVGALNPSIGQIELVSGEIGEDLAYYFAISEQINSAVMLGVLVNTELEIEKAGGLILQLLPDVSEDDIEELEKNIKSLDSMTTMLLNGNSLEDIIKKVAGNLDYKIHERLDNVKFKCDCSKESVTEVLKSVGLKEIRLILKEDKKAEVICHFCNTGYDFTEEELKDVAKKMEQEWIEEKTKINFIDEF